MNVTLTPKMMEYIEGKVDNGLYGSISEFVREAVRKRMLEDQNQENKLKILMAELGKGLDDIRNGHTTNMTAKEIVAEYKQEKNQ